MPEVKDIIAQLKPIKFIGNDKLLVKNILPLEKSTSDNDLFWCSDKNIEKLKTINSGTVILSEKGMEWIAENIPNSSFQFIVVENPRRYFMEVVQSFFSDKEPMGFVSPSANIHSSVSYLPDQVYIGHNVVIEKNVMLGTNVTIMHNTVIMSGTIIGSNVKIGSNSTIGGIGFGYEKNELGEYEQIPHIGNVQLDDFVEIGNNVAIDRAVLGSTILRKNCKVDNLVHIAHGVEIGENSLIIANAMVAGSVSIGKNVWLAPSSSIIQKTKIGDNAIIGMSSNVLKDVEAGSVVAGNPAKKIK